METIYRDLTYGEAFAKGDQVEDTLTKRWVTIPESWVTNKAVFTKGGIFGEQKTKIRRKVEAV